jgi:hypothetical protein
MKKLKVDSMQHEQPLPSISQNLLSDPSTVLNYRPFPPSPPPNPADVAMEMFRHRNKKASEEGFVGAFPNFHVAQYGLNHVGGTIFLKPGMAEWRDVYLTSLGNPPLNDFYARMKATQNYATRNGFVGGFPNFYHANYGNGIVCGTILLPASSAEWRDVLFSEMGNPRLDDIGARFRAAHDYARANGFIGGFPNFYHAYYDRGLVGGLILIKPHAGVWKDVVTATDPRD